MRWFLAVLLLLPLGCAKDSGPVTFQLRVRPVEEGSYEVTVDGDPVGPQDVVEIVFPSYDDATQESFSVESWSEGVRVDARILEPGGCAPCNEKMGSSPDLEMLFACVTSDGSVRVGSLGCRYGSAGLCDVEGNCDAQ